LAPAAGPGWEEPTSQSYRKFLSGSDYVFTPRTSSIGGSAYDGAAFCGRPSCVVTARRNVPRRTAAWAISLRRRYSARSVVTGSYGLIVLLPVGQDRNATKTGPPYGRTARSRVAPVHPLPFDSKDAAGRCSSFEPLSLSSIVEEVPLERTLFVAVCCPYIAAS
jgi:hypothetical protein